ncbi:MAG: 3-deoxy-manno-octulosonate-8-phosphatase KdsC [Betaproteobacteria bacterium]|nr:3-deoxy-manno-octulosonate-8-phosphatase KdsC [Betaproteobacteria bacterium]
MSELLNKAKDVRLFIFDVDGVLTDGTLYLGDDGQEYKAFNSLDGHGMKMLKASGVELAIITGRRSQCVAHRAANLGIAHLHQGVEDKLAAYETLIASLGLAPGQTGYMGDDVIDLPVLRRVGFAVCVPAAPELVKAHVHYVTQRPGGRGAAREVCELVMQAQHTFDAQMAAYRV